MTEIGLDFEGYIDPLHLREYFEMLKTARAARTAFIDNGGSKGAARRHYGQTIHICETVIADFWQWQENNKS